MVSRAVGAAAASPFVWAGVLSVGVALAVGAVVWRQHTARDARTYAVLMVVLAAWAGLYVVQLLEPSVAGKRPWLVARHAVTPLIAVLFWVFAARYTDRSYLLGTRYTVPMLAAGGVLALVALTNPADSYWADLTLYTAGALPRVDVDFGPTFWLMALYVVAVVGGGHGYLVAKLRNSFSVYRRQLAAMTAVGTIEFALMAVFLSEHVGLAPDLNPWPHVQLITYNMVFVAVPLGWSYFRESLFTLQVLDRQSVVENMDDAVFVFDTDGVLRNVNAAGVALTADTQPLVGRTVTEVFARQPVVLDAYRRDGGAPEPGGTETPPGTPRGGDAPASDVPGVSTDGERTGGAVELVVDDKRRWYDIRVSAIENSAGDRTGTVLVARDVTLRRRQREMLAERTAELERKTERLERQNERLDQFAGVVSHDLRNPLMVASGHLTLVREEVPEENFAAIEDSLERMETMIDDLLTLARAGRSVETAQPVGLAETARTAWSHAETADCAFEPRVDEDVTVRADGDRLLHVFENLYRNAIDHNDPPLTVRVGTLGTGDDLRGFYVEDDGRGVPEDERGDVFEHGYTTSDDGTGLGLSIVEDMVEAHGWTIELVEGTDGGARLEVTGVEASR